jgi:hypothetical protein
MKSLRLRSDAGSRGRAFSTAGLSHRQQHRLGPRARHHGGRPARQSASGVASTLPLTDDGSSAGVERLFPSSGRPGVPPAKVDTRRSKPTFEAEGVGGRAQPELPDKLRRRVDERGCCTSLREAFGQGAAARTTRPLKFWKVPTVDDGPRDRRLSESVGCMPAVSRASVVTTLNVRSRRVLAGGQRPIGGVEQGVDTTDPRMRPPLSTATTAAGWVTPNSDPSAACHGRSGLDSRRYAAASAAVPGRSGSHLHHCVLRSPRRGTSAGRRGPPALARRFASSPLETDGPVADPGTAPRGSSSFSAVISPVRPLRMAGEGRPREPPRPVRVLEHQGRARVDDATCWPGRRLGAPRTAGAN